jgi:hypothetical protein
MTEDEARAVASLTEKYDRIAALRADYDRTGGVVDRAAVAALAQRWPGAVRELDTLAPAVLSARREALRAAGTGEGAVPAWAVAHDAWHRVMVAALWVKAQVRRDAVDDGARDAALAAGATARAGVALGEGFVAAVRRPPGGRLAAVVTAVVARHHGGVEGA